MYNMFEGELAQKLIKANDEVEALKTQFLESDGYIGTSKFTTLEEFYQYFFDMDTPVNILRVD